MRQNLLTPREEQILLAWIGTRTKQKFLSEIVGDYTITEHRGLQILSNIMLKLGWKYDYECFRISSDELSDMNPWKKIKPIDGLRAGGQRDMSG